MADQSYDDPKHCKICGASLVRQQSRALTAAMMSFCQKAYKVPKNVSGQACMACYSALGRLEKANDVRALRNFLNDNEQDAADVVDALEDDDAELVHAAAMKARRALQDDADRERIKRGETAAALASQHKHDVAARAAERKRLSERERLRQDVRDLAAFVDARAPGANSSLADAGMSSRTMERVRDTQRWLSTLTPHSFKPGALELTDEFMSRTDIQTLMNTYGVSRRALQWILNLSHARFIRTAGLTNAVAGWNELMQSKNETYHMLATDEGYVGSIEAVIREQIERNAALSPDHAHRVRRLARASAPPATSSTATHGPVRRAVVKFNIDKSIVGDSMQIVVFHMTVLWPGERSTSPYCSVLFALFSRKSKEPAPDYALDSSAAIVFNCAARMNAEFESIRRNGVRVNIDGDAMSVDCIFLDGLDLAGQWSFFDEDRFMCLWCGRSRGFYDEDQDDTARAAAAAAAAAAGDDDSITSLYELTPALGLGERGRDWDALPDIMHSVMCVVKSMLRCGAKQTDAQSGKGAMSRRKAARVAFMAAIADVTHTKQQLFEHCLEHGNIATFKVRGLNLAHYKLLLEGADKIFAVVREHGAHKSYGAATLPLMKLICSWTTTMTRTERDALHAAALAARRDNSALWHHENGSVYAHIELTEYPHLANVVDQLGVTRVQTSNISSEHAIGALKKHLHSHTTTKGGKSMERAIASFNVTADQHNFGLSAPSPSSPTKSPTKKKTKK